MDATQIIDALKIPAGIVAAFGAALAARYYLRPLRIVPSCSMVFDGSSPDSIAAKITNLTDKPVVLTRVVAKPTFPLKTIVLRHLRRPLTPVRLWPNIRYGFPVYELQGSEPIRLGRKQNR